MAKMPINTESQGFISPFAQGGSLCYSVNVGVFNKFYNRKVKYIFLRSRSIILWKHEGRTLTCKQHSHLGGEQARRRASKGARVGKVIGHRD